jgi:hypothetical protein
MEETPPAEVSVVQPEAAAAAAGSGEGEAASSGGDDATTPPVVTEAVSVEDSSAGPAVYVFFVFLVWMSAGMEGFVRGCH